MRSEADVALGIDLGTSSVGVVALDSAGTVVARADNPVPLHTPRAGWTEQDPADWTSAAEAGMRAVGAAIDPTRVAVIGLSGQMHGMVALDGEGRVVHPAILWNDGRTADQVAAIERVVGRDPVVRRTGNRPVPGFQLPKVLWLRDNLPEVFARVEHVLFPKDYLGMHLTGRRYAEPSDASGSGCFDLAAREWDAGILGALDLAPNLWPELVHSHEIVGELHSGLASRVGLPAGTPVVAGAGDNAAAAAALGLGSTGPTVVGSVSLGTSGVVQVPAAAPEGDPEGRVHLFADAFGDYLMLGVTLAAAGSLRWYRDTFAPGVGYQELMARAAASAPGANGVTFVPYLAGERTPHMRSDLRASFNGLSLATTDGDMVRAVIEGVAYALRDALDVMRPVLATSPQRFLATGGGAVSDLWLQTIATLYGTPIGRPIDARGGAYEVGAAEGAAVLAWRGLGVTVDTAPRHERLFEPGAELAALEDGYARYLESSRRN
ncbi:MAG: xylulokinase [Trueperaceae bacterium]|nr:xylulokinase [Trueperaceae bacterium]